MYVSVLFLFFPIFFSIYVILLLRMGMSSRPTCRPGITAQTSVRRSLAVVNLQGIDDVVKSIMPKTHPQYQTLDPLPHQSFGVLHLLAVEAFEDEVPSRYLRGRGYLQHT
jgi:hypothetical protein